MSNLTISLLGPPEIALDGQPLTFESRKAVALLAYLAVTGMGHRRAELAALLWPESSQQRARGALRYTLSLLKKEVGEDWLRIERQSIALQNGTPIWLDVAEFRNLLAEGQTHPHGQDEICSDCFRPLSQAVNLYRGDFLSGFSLRDSPDFDEWQFFQTEGLRRNMGFALEGLTRYYAAQAEVKTATDYAQRWLNLDPLHEPVHRELMGLYAAAGQRAAALRQYQACVRMLDEEFGLPPSAETINLHKDLHQDQATRDHGDLDATQHISPPPPPSASPLPINNLPQSLTPFVGRKQELADLLQLIENDDVRLLTILGPGGIGKTRLAIEIGNTRRVTFAHGVYFVSLASLNAANAIVPAIAQTIGFSFSEGREPEAQLLDYLSSRRVLLLLDSVEHLLSERASSLVSLISPMLQAAPGLKIVTTSRVRLNLQVEYVYPLQGLAHPIEMMFGEAILNGEGLLSTARYPALTLFQQRAQQVQPGLSRSGLKDVVRICRLAEGMPLAIELAAAMTGVLALPAIATEIERNLDILSTDRKDVHARHRSMRAVFDSSWQTLTRAEQAVFTRLSVIRGSFTRQAAAQISQATLDDLAGLVNKSLLHHRSSGRYEIHELMRQYAAEQLAATPAEQEATKQRHCSYYQQLLSRSLAKWQTNYHPQNMAAIALEIDNLRAGWQWALTRQDLKVVWSYTRSLWHFYKARGRFSEAVETLTQTLQLIATDEPDPTQRQQAECERLLGEAYFGLGQIETSQKHLYRALSLVDQPATASGGRTLSTFGWQILFHLLRRLPLVSGKRYSEQEKESFLIAAKIYNRISIIDYTTSRSIPYAAVRGLNLAEMAGPSPILAITYANMASFYSIISRRRWAEYYAHLAEKIINRFHDLPARAAVTLRLAIYQGALGQWEQAAVEGRRALRWYQQLEDQRNWGDCLAALGIISLIHGHFHDCITYTTALQTLSASNYNLEHQTWAVCGQALGLLRLGRTDEALALAAKITPLINQGDRTTDHAKAAYYSVMAIAHLRQEKKEAALQAADSAVALLRNKASLNIAIVLFYSHVAEVYLTLWEQAILESGAAGPASLRHCQTQAQQICQNLYRLAWLLSTRRPFAYLYQAHYEWLAGRRRRAKRLWFKSLANAKRLASPHIEGMAHYQIGRHLPLDDAKRTMHLRCAVEIFETLKAEYDLNLAQIALAEGGPAQI